MKEGSIKRLFEVGPGGLLTANLQRSSIRIVSRDDATLDVEVIERVDAENHEQVDHTPAEFEVDISSEGDNVRIQSKLQSDESDDEDSNRGRWLDILVSVPTNYNVDLTTSGGNVTVDDLTGNVQSKVSGGNLFLENIQGLVSCEVSGGSIHLLASSGSAKLRTSGGNINIGEAGSDVEARTSGGSINIRRAGSRVVAMVSGGGVNVGSALGGIMAKASGGTVTVYIRDQPQADCSLSASGGSVNVYLAENTAFDVDAQTAGGRFESEFPVTVEGDRRSSSAKGSINGGGATLTLRTSGGNISLKKLAPLEFGG
jgi:DUF4097 and DUF4098 domain-containing protein YvlB